MFKVHLPLQMTLGECPVWDAEHQVLYWVDIHAAQLHRLDSARNAHSIVTLDEAIGCIALHEEGGFVAGLRSGIWRLDQKGRKLDCLASNPEDASTNRFNDGRCDPAGRLWIGTLDEAETSPTAALYRYQSGQLAVIKHEITISNGLAFSPDGHYLYHADSPRRIIERHALDITSGELGPAEQWLDISDVDIAGFPDGGAVDSEGYYWCALYAGGAVARFTPEGRLAAHYPLPVPNPTMIAFGDKDLRTLYVTSARQGMDEYSLTLAPLSGSLFSMRVDTPGLREPRYGDTSRML
ncbi:SMP-30/gluconolactonase/LRE family protein [Phytohalomonas tamaricis]|uniref:SMP-30/gluconolactonase/LRE family protein n=1 Tax=Phytohalomonas tamaricis TaxID=2081032 RepID=UPI000D0AD8AB|nr:SMP-30/gluconolactonase/LRE family protein [Phytohalomonas tamaricis]